MAQTSLPHALIDLLLFMPKQCWYLIASDQNEDPLFADAAPFLTAIYHRNSSACLSNPTYIFGSYVYGNFATMTGSVVAITHFIVLRGANTFCQKKPRSPQSTGSCWWHLDDTRCTNLCAIARGSPALLNFQSLASGEDGMAACCL